jgi:hypothetical protein
MIGVLATAMRELPANWFSGRQPKKQLKGP